MTGGAGSAAWSRPALRVAFGGLVVYLAVVTLLALTHGGNAEWFMKFGSASPVTSYGRQVLGDDLVVPYDEAQDGTAFWLVARDPFVTDPATLTAYTDRPAYRAERVAYPLLAAPFRLGGEQALVWGLVIVNLAIVFVGGYVTARLAEVVGAPVRAGYAFALNPLVLAAVVLDLADALTVALLVALVLAVRRGRWGVAVALAVAAVLTKESSLLAVAAVAAGSVVGVVVGAPDAGATWRRRIELVAVPALVLGAWAAYVRWRVGTHASQIEEVTAMPFGGYAQAWRLAWSPEHLWGNAFVAGLLVVIAVVVVVRWWKRRTLELWAALPYAVLVPFLSGQVVHWSINSIRAIGPALTLLALDVAATRRPARTAAVAPAPAT
jgi:hypothetical protein